MEMRRALRKFRIKLTCQEVVDCSSRFVDGDLPVTTRLAVRFHLALCCYCREYLKQIRMIAKAFHSEDGDIDEKSAQAIVQRSLKELEEQDSHN